MAWFFTTFFISFTRTLLHNRGSLLSWWGQPVVVVGNFKDVSTVIRYLHRSRRMAIRPVAAMIFDGALPTEIDEAVPFYSFSQARIDQIKAAGIRQVVYASHTVEINKAQKQRLYALSLAFNKLIYIMGESPLSTLSMTTLDLKVTRRCRCNTIC
jgi:hypothetical protein